MTIEPKRIDIIMATYQGAPFIKAQIASIIKQTYKNWRLLICDDCSSDGTKEAIESFTKNPKIKVIPNIERLGIIGNFSKLLMETDAQYVMFSDQDDIWFSDKIRKSLDEMERLEAKFGVETPLLVHTDLRVVNRALEQIHPSFSKYANLNCENRTQLNQLLAQNVVTGCTMMINRPLAQLVSPIPKDVCMHDWWIGLTAAAFGKIGFVPQATIAYRQHGNNSVGAKEYGFINGLKSIWSQRGDSSKNKMRARRSIQSALFKERHQKKLDKATLEMLDGYQNFCKGSMLQKYQAMKKYGFYKTGMLRNIYEILS